MKTTIEKLIRIVKKSEGRKVTTVICQILSQNSNVNDSHLTGYMSKH